MKVIDVRNAINNYRHHYENQTGWLSLSIFGYHPILQALEEYRDSLPADPQTPLSIDQQTGILDILVTGHVDPETNRINTLKYPYPSSKEEERCVGFFLQTLFQINSFTRLELFLDALSVLRQAGCLIPTFYAAVLGFARHHDSMYKCVELAHCLLSVITYKLDITDENIRFITHYVSSHDISEFQRRRFTLVNAMASLIKAGIWTHETKQLLATTDAEYHFYLSSFMLEFNTFGALEQLINPTRELLVTLNHRATANHLPSDKVSVELGVRLTEWLTLIKSGLMNQHSRQLLSLVDVSDMNKMQDVIKALHAANALTEAAVAAFKTAQKCFQDQHFYSMDLSAVGVSIIKLHHAGKLSTDNMRHIAHPEIATLCDVFIFLSTHRLFTPERFNTIIKLGDPGNPIYTELERIKAACPASEEALSLAVSRLDASPSEASQNAFFFADIANAVILLDRAHLLPRLSNAFLECKEPWHWVTRRLERLSKANLLTAENASLSLTRPDADTRINRLLREPRSPVAREVPPGHSFLANIGDRPPATPVAETPQKDKRHKSQRK